MKGIKQLKNLLEINNDRTLGFNKALEDLEPANGDLNIIFTEAAEESQRFSQELALCVEQCGAEADEEDESVAGAMHRAWIDVKALFGGKDRKSILEEAERGEDAIKAAYEKVLESGVLTGDPLETVTKQAAQIKISHDKIKALRDSAN